MRLLALPIVILAFVGTGDEPRGPDLRAARLREMRAIADGVTVRKSDPSGSQPLTRLAEPVYRFDDPARSFADGTIWGWGRSGRPAALLTMARERAPEGGLRWIVELTSLAPGPISADVAGGATWQPSDPGIVLREFPGAPPPAKDPAKRLLQMKELVREIKAHEFFQPPDQPELRRYELRALPVPVHRYSDEASGLIDGGLFIISYGVNPELVLLIEANRKGTSPPTWSFGLGRTAIAALHVEFKGQEIWSHPGGLPKGPQDTYWIFLKPAAGE